MGEGGGSIGEGKFREGGGERNSGISGNQRSKIQMSKTAARSLEKRSHQEYWVDTSGPKICNGDTTQKGRWGVLRT